MIFTKDVNKADILLDNNYNNYQTMMEWEKPYMEHLINNLSPTGDVLEIGFGLGYSANQIQKFNIKSHTIIECDKDVLIKTNEWVKTTKRKTSVVEGYWQDVLKNLGKFDCVFFDDSPNSKYPDKENNRFQEFLKQIINHVKPFTRLTWYCERNDLIFDKYDAKLNFTNFLIDIPKNCVYNSNSNFMLCPLLIYNENV